MTNISVSGSKEHITGEYADSSPSFCTYYAYRCTYCEVFFYLVDPKTKQAMGAKRTVQYRNPDTGEIAARENRSEGICMSCAKEIMRRQLDFSGRDESFSIK
jgi:hypothetical protein